MRVVIILLVLLMLGSVDRASAQQTDKCKVCREQQRACLQAHSRAACTMEHDMCMKQCRKK